VPEVVGDLRKMRSELSEPVNYVLPVGDQLVDMNALIGREISFQFTGDIHCVSCGRKTGKSFNQGHCFPCFRSLASCDSCIIKPEQCHHAEGTCREPAWAEDNCMQPHVVYLANSSGLKVGITRQSQIPTRWIDQGAVQAIPLFQVSQRYYSGLLEDGLKQYLNDKTDWRRMLKSQPEQVDMVSERERVLALANGLVSGIRSRFGDEAVSALLPEPVVLNYPVTTYPDKVKAHNFDKTAEVSGVLQGIKGQYLILNSGVLNIRKFGGYRVRVQY